MTEVINRIVPILAVLALSCAGPARYTPDPDQKEKPIPLLIWIDGDAKISHEDTLRACEEWKIKGIQCYVVENKLKSHIQIYSQDKKCPPTKTGGSTLATAWRGGKIIFNMKCFGAIGKPNRHKFRAVMVHEIGHHLGIWNHVPEECDDDSEGEVKKHPNGKLVCGEAVMNPYYEKDVYFITPADSLAFDVRNRFIAVVVDPPPGEPADEPDCTYSAQ